MKITAIKELLQPEFIPGEYNNVEKLWDTEYIYYKLKIENDHN